MNFEQIEALRALIDYTKENEWKHYEENDRPAGHVYELALICERYLDGN